MTRLVIVGPKRMEDVLLSLGFQRVRQRGSHVRYVHPDGRKTTIPFHGNRDLSRPLIRDILKDIDISPDVFLEILSEV